MEEKIVEEKSTQAEAQAMADAAPAVKPVAKAPSRNLANYPRIWWGLGLGIAAAVALAAFLLIGGADILASLVSAVFAYFFVASLVLWDDCAVVSVIAWFGERSISFPGLIWAFSFDGFIWLIGMKLLFWLVGVIFGFLCTILGILVAALISPIAYFFGLHEYIDTKN